MAKRFTDTDKWKKDFIKGLKPKMKLLWFYILDDCNHAGIWEVDLKVAGLRIGARVTMEEAFEHLGRNITPIGRNKWLINDFCLFQYGELNPKNRLHQSVISILNSYNIKINKGLISPLEGAKEKDKELDKDKEQDKDKETPAEPEKLGYTITGNETLDEVAFWTDQVLAGNDVLFLNMVRGQSIQLNGQLERLARDHLALCSRYGWHERMTSQQAFRQSLLKHVTEKVNEKVKTTQKDISDRKKKFDDL